MLTISPHTYEQVAALLAPKLTETNLFNGSIEYDTDEFYSKLICTLIVCRDPESGAIISLLPVWWEYHLYTTCGEELTDFEWRDLDQHLSRLF